MDIAEILSSLGLGEHENEITPEALPYLVGCGPQGGSGWLDGEPSTASNADGDGGGWGAPRARFGADAWDAR